MILLVHMPTGPERVVAIAIMTIGLYLALVGIAAWWGSRR